MRRAGKSDALQQRVKQFSFTRFACPAARKLSPLAGRPRTRTMISPRAHPAE